MKSEHRQRTKNEMRHFFAISLSVSVSFALYRCRCMIEMILEIQLDFLVNYQTKDIVELNDI